MRVLTVKVVDGRLDVPEGCLEEGATVILLVSEGEEGFRLSPEEQSLLLESIGQGYRGEVVDGWKFLGQLKD